MEDHHVDRPDVEAWQHVKLTGTNSSKYLIFWRVEKKFVVFSYNFIYIYFFGVYSWNTHPINLYAFFFPRGGAVW